MKNVYAKWDKMNLILWAPGCWILEGSWRRVAVSASSSARRLRRWSRSLTCRQQTWQTKSEKTETNSTTRLKKTYSAFENYLQLISALPKGQTNLLQVTLNQILMLGQKWYKLSTALVLQMQGRAAAVISGTRCIIWKNSSLWNQKDAS